MSTKQKTNKATRTLSFTTIMAGIAQHVAAAIVLGGASMTQAALIAIYQAALQAQTDLDAARQAVTARVQAHKKALAAADAVTVLLHRWAQGQFGPESPVLQDFGFVPATPTDKTVAVKAGAAAKSTATRKAKKAALAGTGSPGAQPAAPAAAPPAATPAVKS